MRRATRLLTCYALCTTIGCSSVKSTAINRTESDVFIGNSNGKPKTHCSARPFNGVPITLSVPTHLDVTIQEKIQFIVTEDEVSKDKHLKRIKGPRRNFVVQRETIHTDKIFTVNPKRAAAGTSEYDMRFRNSGNSSTDQYFESITSKVEDNTIDDITGALGGITAALTTPAGQDGSTAETDNKIYTETRTVAWPRFDIDTPGFEQQVADFVNQHINDCHACGPPKIQSLPRAYHPGVFNESAGIVGGNVIYEQVNRSEPVPGDDSIKAQQR